MVGPVTLTHIYIHTTRRERVLGPGPQPPETSGSSLAEEGVGQGGMRGCSEMLLGGVRDLL